jgi:hypothetical protein
LQQQKKEWRDALGIEFWLRVEQRQRRLGWKRGWWRPRLHFLLVSDEALVAACAPELAVKLQGKGGGRKGKYQGKATGMDSKSRHEAFALLTAKVAELAAAGSKSA